VASATSELGQRDITAARPLGLELLPEPLVQPGPVRGGQLAVGVLAEQVVGEAVPVRAVLAEHPGPHRLGQRPGHRLGLLTSGPGHQVSGKPRPGHGRGPQGRGARAGERRETLLQGLPYPGRHALAAVLQQPGHLLREERVAAGAPVHVGGHVPGSLLAYHVLDQLGDRRDVQAGERHDRGSGRQGGQRGTGGRVHVAVGAHDGRGTRGQAPGQEVQQQLRGLIGPLQVVEEHEQRLDPRLGQQHRGHLVEQLKAGGRGRGIDSAANHGAADHGGRANSSRERRIQPERPHDLNPGPVAGSALARPAPSPGDAGTPGFCVMAQFCEQRGLADPRLSGQQQQVAPPGQRLIDDAVQLAQHVVPADRAGPHLRPAACSRGGSPPRRHPTTVTGRSQ
jgi:hypothetical protein